MPQTLVNTVYFGRLQIKLARLISSITNPHRIADAKARAVSAPSRMRVSVRLS